MRTALLRRRRLVDSVDPTFITTWQTTTAAESITLPLISSGTYDFEVDWGDGSSDVITAFDDPARIHTYAEAGVRDVRISGMCEGWRFASVPTSREEIVNVKNWGSLVITGSAAFEACVNLDVTADDAPSIATGNLNLSFSFANLALDGDGFNKWDVSSVTTLENAFRFSQFNQNISGWDVSSVVSMNATFRATPFNQNISGWDVSNVLVLTETLRAASSFNQNLGGWPLRRAGVNMGALLDNSGLSPENYSRTLIGWANYVASSPGGPFDVPLGASGLTYNNTVYEPGATYTNAVDARNYLTTATLDGGAGWTITDGGLAP